MNTERLNRQSLRPIWLTLIAVACGSFLALEASSQSQAAPTPAPVNADPVDAAPMQIQSQAFADHGPSYTHLTKARALYESNHYHAAQKEYEKSLAVKRTPEAYLGLGQTAEKLQGVGFGRADFEEAIKVDPNFAPAHHALGMLLLNNRDLVGANTELSTALKLDRSDQEAAHSLIGLWQEQLAKAPNANSHFGLARAYQLSGALDSAQAEYREVVRLEPDPYPTLPMARQSFKRAFGQARGGKRSEAGRDTGGSRAPVRGLSAGGSGHGLQSRQYGVQAISG